MIFGVAGALRKDELWKLETSDVQDLGSKFLVTVKASKTHTNRIFTIVGNDENNLLNLIRRYMSLRPRNTPHKRFFIFHKLDKCSIQPVGINTFSKLPSIIATFLKLEQPHLYTGHCFRRSSASILSDSGADFSAIKRLGGWKSTAVAEGYIENSLQNKVDTAEKILGTTTKAPHSNPISATTSAEAHYLTNIKENDINLNLNREYHTTTDNVSVPCFNFTNCTISNVNISIHKK